MSKQTIYVCMGKQCRNKASADIYRRVQKINNIDVKPHICLGQCDQGPKIVIQAKSKLKSHNKVKLNQIDKLLKNQ